MKVVLELELTGGKRVVSTADELKKAISDIKKELGSKEFQGDSHKRLNTELGKALALQKSFAAESRKAANEAASQGKTGEGAYRRMSAELTVLRDRLKDIQASGGIVSKEDLSRVRQLDKELKKIDANFGQFTRNVGNYRGAVREGVRGAAGAISGGLLMGGAIGVGAAVGNAALNVWKDSISIITNFEQAIADLSAIANVSDIELNKLKESAKDLGSTTAFTATEVAGLQLELSKLGFTTDEILALSESVIQLSIGLGGGAAETAALLGATLNGFGAEASEAARYAEVLAAAANKSALDFNDFGMTLPRVSAAAKALGITVEETAAMLGVLRDNGIRAETAGVGLRNIFLEAAKTGKPYEELLQEIRDSTNQLGTATELFGKENAIQAITIANSTAALEEMEAAITGTTGALDRLANVKLDTVQGQMTLLRSAWEGFVLSADDGDGIFSNISKWAISSVREFVTGMTALNEGLLDYTKNSQEYTQALVGNAEVIAELERRQALALNRGGGRGRGGLAQIMKDEAAALEEIKKTTEGASGAGGGSVKKSGVYGSIDYYNSILKGFEERLPLIKQEGAEYDALIVKVDEYRQIVDKLKASEKQRFDALEEQRRRAADPANNTPTSGVGTINMIPGSISQLPPSQTQEAIDKRNKFALDQQQKWNDAHIQQGIEHLEELKRLEQERFDFEQGLKQLGFEIAQTFLNAQFDQELAQIEKLKNAKLDALDVETKAKIKAAEGNETEISKIEYEALKEREKIELEARKRQWQLDIKAALINGALAIGQAFATVPWPASLLAAAAVAATTAAQVSTIRANGYAEGGFTPSQSGKLGPRDSSGQRVAGVVHESEYVAPTRQIRKHPELFNYLESERRGFAEGGFTSAVSSLVSSGATPGFIETSSVTQSMELGLIIENAVMRGAIEGTRIGAEMGAKSATMANNLQNERLQRLRQNISA